MFIEYLSSLSILPAFILGIKNYNKYNNNFQILFWLIYVGVGFELYSWFMQPQQIESKYLANICWHLFELLMICLFYSVMIKMKYLFPWAIAYFIVAYQTDAINSYNPSLGLMMLIPLIIISSAGLYWSVKNKDLAVGIVSFGLLLYFTTVIPMFLYYHSISRGFWVLHSFSNILMNLFIAGGFYCAIYRTRNIKNQSSVLGWFSIISDNSDINSN